MLETVEEGSKSLELTEEFLERRFPDLKEEILDILISHGITTDAEIAFDQRMHLKFKDISDELDGRQTLEKLLKEFEIIIGADKNEKVLDSIKLEREEKLKIVVSHLLKLAKVWTIHNQIEAEVDDFSKLTDEELIRPDEEKKLELLTEKTAESFTLISSLTHQYLELFAEYYFNYGGDIPLDNFLKELEELKEFTAGKYRDLFIKHGLTHLGTGF
jgi:predicted AAA+ superfamily ATPase